MDAQAALTPTNVVEADGDDLAGSESISSDQQKHCVVAQSHSGLLVDAFQKRCDRVPWKGARQLFKPVQPGSVDLAIESSSYPAIGGEETKQATNGGDLMLQARAAQALARLCDVRLDVAWLNGAECDTGRFQMVHKTA